MKIHPIACGFGFAFLIETPDGLYLVDGGSPGMQDRVLAKLKALGRTDLRLIWITHAHYDHYGSAAALRNLTGAAIGIHPDDAQSLAAGQSPLGTTRRYGFFYPVAQRVLNRIWPLAAAPPDFTLSDGETLEHFGLHATILHTPGHTPGHTCVMLEGGIGFAGDLIGGSPGPGLQKLLATDWQQLSSSLERLKAWIPKQVYIGHSREPLSGETIERL